MLYIVCTRDTENMVYYELCLVRAVCKGGLKLPYIKKTDGTWEKFGLGNTPYIGDNGNWWIGNTDTGVKAQGEPGEKGDPGDDYILTETDKAEIAQAAADLIDGSLLSIIGEVS